MENVTYVKNGQFVLIDEGNSFVYETSVYLYHKNYFSLMSKKYFSSNKELEKVIGSFWKSPKIQICSELFSAPKQWLIDNGYVVYQKPEKIIKNKKLKPKDNA